MLHARPVIRLSAAALLAAGLALSSWAKTVPELQREIVVENELKAAEVFLADLPAQAAAKASGETAYLKVFSRAAELADLKGLVTGSADAHSIRLGLLQRPDCSFCLDPVAFPAWVEKNAPGGATLGQIEEAMWSWSKLTASQKVWATSRKQAAAWPRLGFAARHAVMREWALAERKALLALNPADAAGAGAFASRAHEAGKALGSHEMTEVWQRSEKLTQAAQSLAEARAKVAMGDDPKQRALLAQAANAATPEARLAALAKIFDHYGGAPAALLAAAPPRDDQKFGADDRKLVADMLKSAMLRETEGTFAGQDLKKFYGEKGVPLEVTFNKTDMSALGWFQPGGNTLFFNERYVEEYLKTRGKSVDDLKRDPELMQNLARVFASTFVHEAQHHQQDVWGKENKLPRLYHQGDEVEAFQADSLFMLQKMRDDKRFREWAVEEAKTSDLVRGDVANARRMEDEGPGYFDRKIPNSHYPELLSSEGHAWCQTTWHNFVADPIAAELKRRAGLPGADRDALEASKRPIKANYATSAAFSADLRTVSSKALRRNLKDAKTAADDAARFYNEIRARQESVAAVTMERYVSLEPKEKP